MAAPHGGDPVEGSDLLEEGVGFKDNGCVDMIKYRWIC